MTEQSSSTVGRAAIDAYLDSVELALIEADAPRIDRLQVLQDLEAQIADMLAREPQPLTEESVHSVLDKLEPPSHFAATYGNGRQTAAPTPSKPHRFGRLPRTPWAILAATSCALLPFAFLLMLLANAMHLRGPLAGLTILTSLFLGVVFTPIALWMAYKQLRVQPGTTGRDLLLKSVVAYGLIAPLLGMFFAAAATEGIAFVPLGLAAFLYLQYLLLRRLWRHMSAALPPQPTNPTSDSNGHAASAPVASTAPMPAV